MSGTNPFRLREAATPSQSRPHGLEAGAEALHQAGIRFPPIDTGVQKSTKTKTVRIISPHYSRNRDDYGISGIVSSPPQPFGGSPPTNIDSPSPIEEPSPIDPFSAQSDEGTSQDDDEDLRRNTIANSAPAMPQNFTSLRMPLKPPKKAPALQFGRDSSAIGSSDESDPVAPIAVTGRPLYNVDDFKRLLLTGEKVPVDGNTAKTPAASIYSSQMVDSNSNIDDPSISPQSLFERQPEVRSESPNISMDVFHPDEERPGLGQPPLAPNMTRSRPSVPPSRHGKLVKSNMPPTVSFESLSSSPSERNSPIAPSLEPLSSTSLENRTHLNKPLPSHPVSESPTSLDAMPVMTTSRQEGTEMTLPLSQHSGLGATKPSPPALPTARRHGQNRSRSSTNDSNRSASLSEDLSQNTHPSSSSSSSITASKPPPLPPPRRAGTAPGVESTGSSSNVEPSFSGTESPHFKPRPPAPPSRTPSTTSVRRLFRTSTTSGSLGGAAAPLPPVPRRRGSSQSQTSFTPSRLSGEYRISSNERSRADSNASSTTQPPANVETHAEGKDLVADLTALQKEVDELRGKFGR
ncbi:MAG: hypothetical protein LQ337_003150 [Flavoplaca oasis]|nr:MAG: hypothetical protein LQ337_003150 [Flavoplaca oasis]